MRVFSYCCLFALLCGSLLRAQPAHAQAQDICGYVPEQEVRHLYALAKNVEFFLDIKENLRAYCKRIRIIKKHDKYLLRNTGEKEFLAERVASIQDIIADISVISIPLKTIKDWIIIVPRDERETMRRMVSIKRARLEALLYIGYLGEDIEFLENLMKTGVATDVGAVDITDAATDVGAVDITDAATDVGAVDITDAATDVKAVDITDTGTVKIIDIINTTVIAE